MAEESWALDGFALHNRPGGLRMFEAVVPPAAKRPTWLDSPDADGALLLEDPRVGTRVHTYRIRYDPAASMNTALASLAALVDKLEGCGRTSGGLALVWTPQGSTKSTTFRALLGEITELPIELGGTNAGWFRKGPVVTVTITCAPFGELAPVSGSPVTASNPVAAVTLANVAGDAPAKTSLLVEETSLGNPLRWIEGGAGLDTTSTLMINASSLVTSGFAGTLVTDATGIDGHAIGAHPLATPTAICGTGVQPHVGTWRVLLRARVQATGRVRLSWRVGDGDYSANDYASGPIDASGAGNPWSRVDLGLITIPTATVGSQAWDGRIEAIDTAPGGGDIDACSLLFIPATAGYFITRAEYRYQAGAIAGYDNFIGTTAAGALNGRTAPAGGAWATSGDTTDFTFADGNFDTGSEEVTRTAASSTNGRFAILGSSVYSDTQVDAAIRANVPTGTSRPVLGVIARWTDSSNYLRATVNFSPTFSAGLLLTQFAGGIPLTATITTFSFTADRYRLRLIVFASGHAIAQVLSRAGALLTQTEMTSAVLATGGVLDDGKVGLFDFMTGPSTPRFYTDFTVSTPLPEPVVAYPGKDFVIDADGARRESASGTAWGRVTPIGTAPVLSAAGAAGVSTRTAVLAHKNDLGAADWNTTTPSFRITVNHTPRVRVAPR